MLSSICSFPAVTVDLLVTVGHIIGLSDRHVQNIMIDEKTGEVVHIDHGKDLRLLGFLRFGHASFLCFRNGIRARSVATDAREGTVSSDARNDQPDGNLRTEWPVPAIVHSHYDGFERIEGYSTANLIGFATRSNIAMDVDSRQGDEETKSAADSAGSGQGGFW